MADSKPDLPAVATASDDAIAPSPTTQKGDVPLTMSSTAQRLWRERTLGWRESVIARVPLTEPILARLDALGALMPPGWAEKLPFLLLAIFFSPRAAAFISTVAVAGFIGYVWAESSHGKRREAFADIDVVVPYGQTPKESYTPPSPTGFLKEVDLLLTHIVRDFIDLWFNNLNHSRSPAFPQAVRDALEHAVLKLRDSIGTTRVTPQIILPVFQRVVAHLREYRTLEASPHELEEYLDEHPDSLFNTHRTRADVIRHLRVISMLLSVELLPRADKSSPIVFEFIHEIIATSVLLPIVDMCSDPDWINMKLVAYLTRKQQKAAAKMAKRKEQAAASPGALPEDEIVVKVLEARKLPFAGVDNVYCSVLCGTNVQRSQKVRAEAHPMWHEEFRFPWDPKDNSGIAGVVVDIFETKLIKDDIVGSSYIPISQLPPNQLIRGWHLVDTSDSRHSATANAELLIEAIRIGPTVSNALNVTERAPTPRITAADVMVRSKALVEFIEYMDAENGSKYVQLYIMMDSFNRFAKLEMAGQGGGNALEGIRADAQAVVATFLTPGAEQYVDLDAKQLVAAARKDIAENPNPNVFKPLQAAVVALLDQRFMDGFRNSAPYREFCAREQATAGASVPPGLASTSASDAESDAETVDITPAVTDHAAAEPSVASPTSPISENSVNRFEKFDGEVVNVNNASDPAASALPSAEKPGALAETASPDHSSMTDTDEALRATEALTRCAQQAADVLAALRLDGSDSPESVQEAIAAFREQVVLIDAVMRASPDSDAVGDLAHVKLQLQTKVEELVELTEAAEHPATPHLDLSNIRVNVLDMSDPADSGPAEEGEKKNIFAFAGVGTPPAPRPADMRYIVQIERVDGSGGWMIAKSYLDLINLNDALEAAHPKVRKSGFPAPRGGSRSGTQQRARAAALPGELERWLNIAVTDEELRATPAMLDFMRPENFAQQLDIAQQTQIQNKVFGSLKSAGTLLRKVAVAAPVRAATMIAGEVGAAAKAAGDGLRKATISGTNAVGAAAAGAVGGVSRTPSLKKASGDQVRFLPRASSLDELAGNLPPPTPPRRTGSPDKTNPSVESQPDAAPSPPRPAPPILPTLATRLDRVVNNGAPTSAGPSPLSDADLETVLECIFGTIEEIFALSDPAQWFRQKGLHVVKTILRRTYGGTISSLLQTRMHEATSEKKVAEHLLALDAAMWPGGTWFSSPRPTTADADSLADKGSAGAVTASVVAAAVAPTPAPERTDQDRANTKMEAKRLFTTAALPGVDTVARVVGRYNTVAGITRLFNMLQSRTLNEGLMCHVLERVVRGLLEK
ncbi:hypothetical protein HDU86_005969 [Geranomyces michiganensis]|nr:hypothetical protein HDU86_005969 [Geranomyces michiganensis]